MRKVHVVIDIPESELITQGVDWFHDLGFNKDGFFTKDSWGSYGTWEVVEVEDGQ